MLGTRTQWQGVLALGTELWFVPCTKGSCGGWEPARVALGPASCAGPHAVPSAPLNKDIVPSGGPAESRRSLRVLCLLSQVPQALRWA